MDFKYNYKKQGGCYGEVIYAVKDCWCCRSFLFDYGVFAYGFNLLFKRRRQALAVLKLIRSCFNQHHQTGINTKYLRGNPLRLP